MTMPAYKFGDPAKVIEREEERSCKGCKHLDRLWGAEWCAIGVGKGGKGNMRRCVKYNDGQGGSNG